ncbi:hypothetical protein AGR1A_Cc20686 [Agrobacterium fabacearum CFBP 5771]|nr:hypothetical protein AGR1A_Cc20686 [Agrobacterium fabacearum CFBP 5771]
MRIHVLKVVMLLRHLEALQRLETSPSSSSGLTRGSTTGRLWILGSSPRMTLNLGRAK